MTEIENIRKMVGQATKLNRIDTESNPVVIEVIRGINPDPSNFNVLDDAGDKLKARLF